MVENVQVHFLVEKQQYIKLKKDLKAQVKAIILRFFDELYQPNAIDKDGITQQNVMKAGPWIILRVRVVKV